MSTDQDNGFDAFRDRIAKQGEDALGRFAQELLENPLVSNTLSRALDARERASQAQEVAMGALNLPSAADVERLTRRLRSVSQRLEGIEDAVDRLDARLERLGTAAPPAPPRESAGVEAQLSRLANEVSRLASVVDPDGGGRSVSREQERLAVDPPAVSAVAREAKRAAPKRAASAKAPAKPRKTAKPKPKPAAPSRSAAPAAKGASR